MHNTPACWWQKNFHGTAFFQHFLRYPEVIGVLPTTAKCLLLHFDRQFPISYFSHFFTKSSKASGQKRTK